MKCGVEGFWSQAPGQWQQDAAATSAAEMLWGAPL